MGGIRPYVVIQDWMLDLGLNPSEVIAVAVIYGFTQDGEHWCHASVDYFGRMCKLKRRATVYMLRRLEAYGLVRRRETAGKVNEYILDFEGCKNCTRAKIAPVQSTTETRAKIAPLSPLHPPIPDNKDNKYKHHGGACAGAHAHTHTREGDEEAEMTAAVEEADPSTGGDSQSSMTVTDTAPQPPGPPSPSGPDEGGLFHVSSMERESVGFDKDRIAGMKRERMAAALERVCARLAAEGTPPMSERQRARFLDHWCAHRPGSERTRAEGDPYFSLYAKARLWTDTDRARAAEKEGAPDGGRKGFAPPSLDEVRAFFAEAAPGMDPMEFYGYYRARGWVFPGGVRMADWKAAVYMWTSREREKRERR